MGKVIVFTSGKGGVGKTTCCANIGIYLSKRGYKVLVIDADIGLRNLDMVIGFEELTGYDIVDVILGYADIHLAMVSHSKYPGFFLLPASARSPEEPISPEKMNMLTQRVRDEFDYILIDSPAGIENGFYAAVYPSDEAVVIVNPEVSSIRDADRILEILKEYKNIPVSLIINRANRKMMASGEMISPSDITDILNTTILGIIPEDKSVIISSNKGLPVVEGASDASDAIKNIADAISGTKTSHEETKKESFFGRMTRKLLWG